MGQEMDGEREREGERERPAIHRKREQLTR